MSTVVYCQQQYTSILEYHRRVCGVDNNTVLLLGSRSGDLSAITATTYWQQQYTNMPAEETYNATSSIPVYWNQYTDILESAVNWNLTDALRGSGVDSNKLPGTPFSSFSCAVATPPVSKPGRSTTSVYWRQQFTSILKLH